MNYNFKERIDKAIKKSYSKRKGKHLLNQDIISKEIGIGADRLSRIINGKTDPRLSTALKIDEYLKSKGV